MSDNPTFCPQCGNPLNENEIGGLCAQCLLKVGLDPASQIQSVDNANAPRTASYSVTEPPSIESLSKAIPHIAFIELIAKGGMGAVYKAKQLSLDRLVAVKVLPQETGQDPTFAERFTREAHALGRLNHPNIVAIHDSGIADGLYYFVMEYIDGVNIRHLLKENSLTPKDALAIVPQICDALQYAHDEGIVHRDIKPENILIDKKGRVKIADFGLAKLLGFELENDNLTFTNQVMGTVKYMAPEQMEGSRDIDHRADIYSLGVVFYEMLTRELPLGRFAPPSARVQIDVRLDEVVMRALEKQPELRFQQADDVKTSVENVMHQSQASRDKSSTSIFERIRTFACKFDEIERPYVRWVWVPMIALALFCTFMTMLTIAFGGPHAGRDSVFGSIAGLIFAFVVLNVIYIVQRLMEVVPALPVGDWNAQQINTIIGRYSLWTKITGVLFLIPWLILMPFHPGFFFLGVASIAITVLAWRGANQLKKNLLPSWYSCLGTMLPLSPACMLGVPLTIRFLRTVSRDEVRRSFKPVD